MESVIPSSLLNLLRTKLQSATRRNHDIENVALSDSSSEEKLMEPPSQQVIEPPGQATRGKQVADSPDSSSEALQMASSSSGPHAVNIDELPAAAERKLVDLPQLSSKCCIDIVPDRMRYSNRRHYTPRVVSIGPIHYHNKKLRSNKHLKERYLAEFRQLTRLSLLDCNERILNQEGRLRNCYADVIDIKSENFVKMVTLDAAFLLMILVYNNFDSLLSSSDEIFGKPHMIYDIRYDMLLLENQLPFFILEDLYEFSKLQNILKRTKPLREFEEKTAMNSLSENFFDAWGITSFERPQPCPNAVHLLDLLRRLLIPADWPPEKKKDKIRNIPSTKELHQAGVKIQVGSKNNMFDIKFQHGILEVPPLVIDDSTELIFRNLLAFELCHCDKQIFSHYFTMMKLLTLSLEDSELLIKNGVIDNELANAHSVSTLFQKIDVGNIVDLSHFFYSDVTEGLYKYYERDWHKWKATLKDKYFKAPWAIFSVSAAVFLLVLTIVQTVFTILQVVLPK